MCKRIITLLYYRTSGVFMRTYYHVSSGFGLSEGKAALTSITLNSTQEYCPYLVRSVDSQLAYSRFFHTLQQAHSYINYLYSRYPDSTVSYPVLDPLQPYLF
jgi:hypothetical protein